MKIIQLVVDAMTSNLKENDVDSRHMIICANIYIEEMLSDYINQTMYVGFCMKFSVMHLG